MAAGGGGNRFSGSSPSRSLSPGRSLMEVKQKLNSFVSGRSGGAPAGECARIWEAHVDGGANQVVLEQHCAYQHDFLYDIPPAYLRIRLPACLSLPTYFLSWSYLS